MCFKQYLLLLIAIVMTGCILPADTMNRNVSNVYRAVEEPQMVEDVAVALQSDSVLGIFINVNAQQLLFSRQQDGSFNALFEMHADLIASYESPAILDSSTFVSSIDLADRDHFVFFRHAMHISHTGDLLVKFHVTDLHRGTSEVHYVNLQINATKGRSAFRASYAKGSPLFNNHVAPSDSIVLRHYDSTLNTVVCRYFKRDFPLATPPFGMDERQPFNYRPDSIFTVSINRDSVMVLKEKGFYHFQTDTATKLGFTLFCFDEGYPKVTTTRQLLGPLRYLTVRSEYDAIASSIAMRKSIDQFWLDRCKGSKEKSRLLIQHYYHRVQLANTLFGSYTEGWRTDRGMLYVIMGAPTTIYRTSTSETWIYGTVNSPTSLNFMFIKVDNPFTDNDYSLTRSPFYETSWYRAVDVLRQGRAYNN
jgi:GWxTD domain-containing protein